MGSNCRHSDDQQRPLGHVLAAIPAGLVMVATAYAEQLSQSAQLLWPILLLAGATFAAIGLPQTHGYGHADGEPITGFLFARNAFFGGGLLLHLAAFVLLATESRACDHPGGEIAHRRPRGKRMRYFVA